MTADIASRAEKALAHWLLLAEPNEAAMLIERAPPQEAADLLATTNVDTAVAVLRRLTTSTGGAVLRNLPESLRAAAMSLMNHNRVAAMLSTLNEEDRNACFAVVDDAMVRDFKELILYPANTAGAMMDPHVTSFRPETTVREVIRQLRRKNYQHIRDVFIVTPEGELQAMISLEALVLADSNRALSSFAAESPIAVQAIASREEILQTFEQHQVATIPVVNFDGHLVGALHQREITRAARDQAAASAVTMVGASEQERALSSPWFAIRKRLPWLQINLLTAFLAAAVVGVFENTIAQVTALAVLLPVVAGQSGNTGAQALAVTMRGLALREVRTRHWYKVAIKESLAGAGNGLAVALVTASAVYFWSGSLALAGVIGISMILSMTLAGLAGAVIPMMLTALGQDPAQSSSIVLTTVTDVVGFFSFLGIATLFMHAL